MKRKARQEIAGGMGDMKSAITALETDIPAAVLEATTAAEDDTAEERPKVVQRGRIGEGKSAPLSKAQRKRAL